MKNRSLKFISFLCVLTFGLQNFAMANQSPPAGCPTATSFTTAQPYNLKDCPPSCPNCFNPPVDTTCPVDPVLLTGGKLYIPVTDVKIPGPGTSRNGFSLQLIRSYSNQIGFSGVFGAGWTSTLDIELITNFIVISGTMKAGSSVTVRDQDSSLLTFLLLTDTQIVPGPVVFTDGQRNVSWYSTGGDPLQGTFAYAKPHGTTYHFDQNFITRLTSISDRSGHSIKFSYDANGFKNSISDDLGRSLNFTYGSNGKISQMTDPLNRIWTYNYDNLLNNLISVKDPLNRKVNYSYTDPFDPHNITTVTDAMGYATNYTYNSTDQVIKEVKPDGSTIQFSYNNLLGTSTMTDQLKNNWSYEYFKIGLGTLALDPTGGVWKYSYDPNTNLMTQKTDALGRATTLAYGSDQNLNQNTDSSGNITAYSYNSSYNFWQSITDRNGHVTSRDFDSHGNVTKLTDASGHITTSTYNNLDELLTQTDPLGNTTSYAYDGYGNLVSQTDALGNTTSFNYDVVGRLLSVTNTLGRTTAFTYDAGDRILKIQFANGSSTNMTYDDDDRLLSVTDPNGNMTKFAYGAPLGSGDSGCSSCSDQGNVNASSHPSTITDAMNHVTTFTYDAHGNVLSVTDADNNQSVFTYDALDRLITSKDPMGAITTLTYDNVGNLLSVKDANSGLTTFVYDAFDRKVSEQDALGNITKFAYDNVGNLISRTDANGNKTSYSYDAVNRLLATTYPDASTVTNVYDAAGNLASMSDATGLTQYVYDKLNRLSQVTFPKGKTMSYTYDAVGNTATMVSTVGTTTYAYDVMNRLTSLTTPKNQVFNYAYDAGGRRTLLTYPNNIQAAYAYDNANRLTSLIYKNTSSNLNTASFSYAYDSVGNRLSLMDNEGTHTYTYDNDYRLTSVVYPAGTKLEYSYDGVGNRLTLKKNGKVSDTYTYDAANRLLTSKNKLYSYDANGDLISEKNTNNAVTRNYTYDFENRLKQATQGTNTDTYTYDGLGRRVEKSVNTKVTRTYYDGFETLFETNSADNIQRSYIHGPRIDETLSLRTGAQDTYYIYDGLGSVSMLTNLSGTSVGTYTYDVFGDTRSKTGSVNNEFQFTGRQWDNETNLYYYRNRYYNPSVGRFITEDPAKFIGGVNFFIYVKNNPTSFIDPFGLFYFAKRKLSDVPIAINNDVLDWNNIELSHEQGFFEDGRQPSNVGFGPNGLFYNEDPSQYERTDNRHYNDDVMREALKIVRTGDFSLFGLDGKEKNNCQDFAERLREVYYLLLDIQRNSG